MADEIIVRVNGWDLVKGEGEDEPRIRDLDLAERLQYRESRLIRKLIKRLIDDGFLACIHVRSTVERTSMPRGGVRETEVQEYYLTEAEALLVISRSETVAATRIMQEVIGVYVALRRGLLAGTNPTQLLAAVRDTLSSELLSIREETRLLKERVVALDRHPNGLMGDTDAAELRRQINVVAHIRQELGEAGVFVSIYRRVDDAIRREVGYPNEKGAKWELCPVAIGTRAFSRVGMMFHSVSVDLAKKKAAEKKAAAEKQIEMFRKAIDAA